MFLVPHINSLKWSIFLVSIFLYKFICILLHETTHCFSPLFEFIISFKILNVIKTIFLQEIKHIVTISWDWLGQCIHVCDNHTNRNRSRSVPVCGQSCILYHCMLSVIINAFWPVLEFQINKITQSLFICLWLFSSV